MATSPSNAVARKGRGATFDPDNRFAPMRVEAVDDGWWQEAVPERLATRVTEEQARSALAWNRSPDLPFDRSLNPYRGCEHGCIYCYARPSHAYWDLSPGLDFETRLIARQGLVERLEEELARPGYECRPINLAGNTDAYQPLEAERGTTRRLLAFLLDCRHPVTLVTKGALVLRDRDLLAELAKRRLVRVLVSLTSLDADLKRTLEPRTAAPATRLKMIERLTDAGVPTGVLVSPVIPGLTDHELERLLDAARAAGAMEARWMLLRLPREVAPLFEDWLAQHYPDRAAKVMSLIRQCRGGQDYDARFGHRMRGQGVFADLLDQRFRQAYRRLDFPGLPALDTDAFRPPRRQGDLFD
ncbi:MULTISPECIES: PA0069 family radical SAM protein [Halomonas]|uniref:Radical SAM protein n=1 Tax=Halomonas halophila TaxID=29573 RepID=A0ABQ0TZ46_9GAMM|nr:MULTISPECIES: PA0069 family radical SAM protein [Halomonas]MDR5889731.1 PA0069 family radical SAM protein [Halomonas salina]WJY06410.1 PA0069 family radical SAM protein [Halomonas halophila]GEK71499.1 radical SAM protein [Halomonas halophila]